MSAETQQRVNSTGGPALVLPQPVCDKGIMESVTGFITEVVPQVSSATHSGDNKDSILWARFEDTEDGNDVLLVLGYGSGVQVWCVNSDGEAREALSWRRGLVRSVRLLLNPEHDVVDAFAHKRPIVALCDSSGPTGQQFCSLSFFSLRVGDQVKIVKYKNPINEIVSSRRVVVVSFPEKLAILDAGTLEERKAIVTCFPVSGPNPNPIALGNRWLAFADKRISSAKLSAGGAESFSGQSYTATVLHAAKSLGKVVASSLTGQKAQGVHGDLHPGVVTLLDVNSIRLQQDGGDEVLAHFVGHTEAIVALSFDPSGMLLLTADKNGHDFHVFRIQPHACGSAGTAVHHLYVLHRGDTVAKVQDVAWTSDSRWVAISTLRGTTHVFALTSYGGPVSVRTHLSSHVVNRQSRFHRSAGLLADGRNSPETVAMMPSTASPNPRQPPYPHPTTLNVLGQIRQSQPPVVEASRPSARHSSTEEPPFLPVRLSACFAAPRGWFPVKQSFKPANTLVDSLYIMSCSGNLIEYQLKPKAISSVPKEKVCDDTPLEMEVQPRAQWNLLRSPHTSELQLPLSPTNPLMPILPMYDLASLDNEENWLSQVEITTHAGPHRRLWMGPQFSFKTFSVKEPEPVDVGTASRSNPSNSPLGSSTQPVVPVLIESASCSLEQSPRLLRDSEDSDSSAGPPDTEIADSLAEAMIENPCAPAVSTDFISL